MRTGRRWVGGCAFCEWTGDEKNSMVYAGYAASHHAKVVHPDKEGFVGYIKEVAK